MEDDYTDTNDLFEGDLIHISEKPLTESWKFIPLFKEGKNGEIRVWQIGFDSVNEDLKIVHGILITTKGENGQLITATHPISINKSNRTLQEQALLEARKRYLDNYKSGYLARGEELPPELNGKEPMLAKTLKIGEGKCKSNETKFQKYPCNVMPKFDGIRALTRDLPHKGIYIRSRKNNEYEAPLTHIKEELDLFLKYLPPNSELDGEMYSMEMSFNELSGVVRTKKRIHVKHDLVKYYIFDIIEPKQLCWEDRYRLIVEAYSKYLEDGNPSKHFRIIQSYTAKSEEEMIMYHNKFVEEGYEGIILRRYAAIEVGKCCRIHLKNSNLDEFCPKCKKAYKLTIYRTRRTNAMLKYKLFIDEEVRVVGFEVGIGTEEGAIIYKVLDERGNEFPVRPRGTVEERRKLYKIRDTLTGKPLTIRYQELSEYGVPRFPVGIAIRDYE